MNSIKNFRETLGLTQEYFADIIKTSKVNYCKKENGTVKFSLNEAKSISEHFRKPIEVIFFDKEVSKMETTCESKTTE